MTIRENEERLAQTMHELAQWSRSRPNSKKYTKGLIKLPPVFLRDDDKHGEGKKNLIAMLRVLADYEEGALDGTFPRLQELPNKYNTYGGKPELSDKDMRRVHNWIQQLSFATRAAVMEEEDTCPTENLKNLPLEERVFHRLYAECERRSFVTFSPDNKYEYKPLKNADGEAKLRWICQEIEQRRAWKRGQRAAYGARPTEQEWEKYGLTGQPVRTACTKIQAELQEMVKLATLYDHLGKYDEASRIDERINRMSQELNLWDTVGA